MSLGIKIHPLYLGDYHHRGMPFSTSEYKGTTLGFEHFSAEAFELWTNKKSSNVHTANIKPQIRKFIQCGCPIKRSSCSITINPTVESLDVLPLTVPLNFAFSLGAEFPILSTTHAKFRYRMVYVCNQNSPKSYCLSSCFSSLNGDTWGSHSAAALST